MRRLKKAEVSHEKTPHTRSEQKERILKRKERLEKMRIHLVPRALTVLFIGGLLFIGYQFFRGHILTFESPAPVENSRENPPSTEQMEIQEVDPVTLYEDELLQLIENHPYERPEIYLTAEGMEKLVYPIDVLETMPELQGETKISPMYREPGMSIHANYLFGEQGAETTNGVITVYYVENMDRDNGEKYTSEFFKKYEAEELTINDKPAVYNPNQNELVIVTDTFIYTLSGTDVDKDMMVELASLFRFENETYWVGKLRDI
ncbi:hypothetical protein OEV98_05585 [Caldibacillus lycopersici]|uniref:Uncharacterized protein n=1 Tax=Perspicuibacillus lycopersici TaxID=1325689 RepID=A0AAE3IRC4_9BACI|nr:hypothetical protein [Perspicuibacillus lycopersici]MCU9613021.1 hypothetical protein [Perspicuibacillus lycopersici]